MKKKAMKKPLKIFLWILFAILMLFIVFVIISCIGSNSNMKYVEANFGAIDAENAQYSYDETTGRYEFVKPVDRDFKILQLTDLHIGGGIFCMGKDKKAFDAVYKMISGVKPDLVVFTGDVLYPFPFQSGNINNTKTAQQFAAFMEKLQVPWTMIYGNHDTEFYTFSNREKLSDYFSSDSLRYSVFTKNPKDTAIDGYGNQIINIRNADGTLNTALVLFDSHANTKGSLLKYDSIHDNQVDWYKNSISELSSPENGFAEGEVAPSLVFTHIPLNEFQYAWDDYKAGGTDSEYLWGVMDEKILAPATGKKFPKAKLFDAILELNSTKAVFCGHNHKNNFAIKYKGVTLNFSKSIVYLGLFGIDKTDAYRGGTLIDVKSGGDFSITSVEINDI